MNSRTDAGESREQLDARWLPFAVVLGLIALPVFVRVGNNDVWEHMKAGQWILQHRAVPRENLFMFTTPHFPLALHTWLSGVLLYLAYQVGETTGVQALEYLCIVGSFLILWHLWFVWGAPATFALPVFALAVGVSQFRYQPRPELFTALGMACLLYLLCSHATGLRAHLWPVPFLFALWTNFHGGMLTGLLVLAIFLLVEELQLFTRVLNRQRSPVIPRCKHLIIVFFLSFLATFINPYGPRYYAALSPQRMEMLRSYITEWRPLTEFLPQVNRLSLLVMAVFVVVVCASWGFAMSAKARGNLRDKADGDQRVLSLLLTLSAAGLAIMAVRNLWVASQVLVCVVALNLSGDPITKKERQGKANRDGWVGCLTAAVVAWMIVYQTISTGQRFGVGADLNGAPVGLAQFMESNNIRGRFFNTMGNSCYLTWRLFPRQKVFIDALNAYDPTIIHASRAFLRAASPEADIARWNLDGFILFESESASPIAQWLSRNPDWALVYWDGETELFLKREKRFAETLRRCEYHLTNPSLTAPRRVGKDHSRFVGEIQRALDNPVQSSSLYVMAGNLCIQTGETQLANQCFAKALTEQPLDLRAWLGQAIAALRSGDPDRAARICRRVLFFRSNTAQAWLVLGIACQQRGDNGRGITAFQEAVGLEHGNWDARQQLALALMAVGRYAEAQRQLKVMLTQRPDSAPAMYALAVALTHEKPPPEGRILLLLNQAIRVQPGIRNLIASDRSYDALRGSPDFQALLYSSK